MSKIVPTKLGTFRQVVDGSRKYFLFECPKCGEWLPMTEAHLQGEESIDHLTRPEEGRTFRATCEFGGKHKLGVELLATMQARVLMGEQPYDEDVLCL